MPPPPPPPPSSAPPPPPAPPAPTAGTRTRGDWSDWTDYSYRANFVKIRVVRDTRAVVVLSAVLGTLILGCLALLAWFVLVYRPRNERRLRRRIAAEVAAALEARGFRDDADAETVVGDKRGEGVKSSLDSSSSSARGETSLGGSAESAQLAEAVELVDLGPSASQPTHGAPSAQPLPPYNPSTPLGAAGHGLYRDDDDDGGMSPATNQPCISYPTPAP